MESGEGGAGRKRDSGLLGLINQAKNSQISLSDRRHRVDTPRACFFPSARTVTSAHDEARAGPCLATIEQQLASPTRKAAVFDNLGHVSDRSRHRHTGRERLYDRIERWRFLSLLRAIRRSPLAVRALAEDDEVCLRDEEFEIVR